VWAGKLLESGKKSPLYTGHSNPSFYWATLTDSRYSLMVLYLNLKSLLPSLCFVTISMIVSMYP
jgi:hypothetical protein